MSGRLYRTTDDEIVAEGDPRAAFLVVGDGGDVPDEFADAVAAFRKGEKPKPEKQTSEKVVEPVAKTAKPKRVTKRKN